MQNPLLSFVIKANILVHLVTYISSAVEGCVEFFKLDHIMGVFNFFPKVIYFKTVGPLTIKVKRLEQYFNPSCHILHSGQPCSSGCEEGGEVKQKMHRLSHAMWILGYL